MLSLKVIYFFFTIVSFLMCPSAFSFICYEEVEVKVSKIISILGPVCLPDSVGSKTGFKETISAEYHFFLLRNVTFLT